jgi:hypothetical protein
MSVEWPPIEAEEKEQQQVTVIQTHLPITRTVNNRQWPPAAPEYVNVEGLSSSF